MDAFALFLGRDGEPAQYVQVASYYESKAQLEQAADFYERAEQYNKALRLYLQVHFTHPLCAARKNLEESYFLRFAEVISFYAENFRTRCNCEI